MSKICIYSNTCSHTEQHMAGAKEQVRYAVSYCFAAAKQMSLWTKYTTRQGTAEQHMLKKCAVRNYIAAIVPIYIADYKACKLHMIRCMQFGLQAIPHIARPSFTCAVRVPTAASSITQFPRVDFTCAVKPSTAAAA